MSLAHPARLRQLKPIEGDLLLTAVLALPVVVSLVARATRQHQPLYVLLAAAALPAVFWRRARPVQALALATAVLVVMPDNRTLLLPVLIVLYTIAAQSRWQIAAVAGAGAAVAVTIAGSLWDTADATAHGGLLGFAIGTVASCAAAVGFGLYVGARRRLLDGLRDRAERLERERKLLADRAVGEERIRIAQELHDVFAHNVSLMVVQAQALSNGSQALRLTIVDGRDEARAGTAVPVGLDGHGLIGMRERATPFGGTLTTEAGRRGGFKVTAMLPYAPATA